MAHSYPRTLVEFEHWFRTEEACRGYLARLRWPEGFVCPRCGHRRAWKTRRRLLHCASCRKDISVTAGTIFHGSHMSLRLWLEAIWWLASQKSGSSARELQRALGLGSYKTAWGCVRKLRGLFEFRYDHRGSARPGALFSQAVQRAVASAKPS